MADHPARSLFAGTLLSGTPTLEARVILISHNMPQSHAMGEAVAIMTGATTLDGSADDTSR